MNTKASERNTEEVAPLREAIERAIVDLEEQSRMAMELSGYDGGGPIAAEKFDRIAAALRSALNES